MSKNFSQYSIDPVTRYPNMNVSFLRPSQVSAPGPSSVSRPRSGPVRRREYRRTQRPFTIQADVFLSWLREASAVSRLASWGSGFSGDRRALSHLLVPVDGAGAQPSSSSQDVKQAPASLPPVTVTRGPPLTFPELVSPSVPWRSPSLLLPGSLCRQTARVA